MLIIRKGPQKHLDSSTYEHSIDSFLENNTLTSVSWLIEYRIHLHLIIKQEWKKLIAENLNTVNPH